MSVQRELEKTMEDGLTIGIHFSKISPEKAKQYGLPEGILSLRISGGASIFFEKEVRENHGKSYARGQKAVMINMLGELQEVFVSAILSLKAEVESMPSAEDEAEVVVR